MYPITYINQKYSYTRTKLIDNVWIELEDGGNVVVSIGEHCKLEERRQSQVHYWSANV